MQQLNEADLEAVEQIKRFENSNFIGEMQKRFESQE